jgi:hypothetical protein
MIGKGMGIGSDVEELLRINPRGGGRRDIPDRIAAGLARGDSDVGQSSHELGCIFKFDKMDLKILSGRHMGVMPTKLLGNIRDTLELIGIEPSERDLDPDHLDPCLTLAINAMLKPKPLKGILTDLAGAKLFDCLLVVIDLVLDLL